MSKPTRILLACAWVVWGAPGGFAQGDNRIHLRTQSKAADFSGFSSTKPFRTGTTLPATCDTGDTFFKNDALPGQTLYGCVAPNTWNLMNPPAGTAANFSASFTNSSVVTILGTTHTLVSANLILECYDNAVPANRLSPTAVTVHPTTFDVVVTFASAQSGRCVLNGYGGGGGGGGGGVSTILAGSGLTVANPSSASPTVSADTAVVLSRATDQAGTDRYCASANASDTYTCNLVPALTAYTPGMTLIFNPDVSNVGPASLNINALGAVPLKVLVGGTLVDPANGDIDAAGIYQLTHDGSAFIVARLDTGTPESRADLTDEFMSGNGIDGQAGQLGWRFAAMEAGTATFARQSSEVGVPGIHRLSTSAGTGHDAALYLGNAFGDFNDMTQSEWDLTWILRPMSTTLVAVRVGLMDSVTSPNPPNGMLLRYSTAAGDTNWTYEMRSASVSDTFATSTAPSTVTFTKLRIWRRTGGVGGNPTIFMTLNGGQQRTWCASGCNHTTANIPTESLKPMVTVETQTTSARSVDVDFFSIRRYGLTR